MVAFLDWLESHGHWVLPLGFLIVGGGVVEDWIKAWRRRGTSEERS